MCITPNKGQYYTVHSMHHLIGKSPSMPMFYIAVKFRNDDECSRWIYIQKYTYITREKIRFKIFHR